jgi:putative glutamine amidotransferase
MSAAPAIGVCAPLQQAQWGAWDLPAAVVAANYLAAVWAEGARTLVIPPDPALVDDPGSVLDRIDGLLLLGGADVAAERYGAAPHADSESPEHDRDAVEIALVRAAIGMGLPTLGICRGLQIINVALGGTLRQHLPDELGSQVHRRYLGRFAGNEHEVRLAPGSLAAAAAGAEVHRVVSHHHQAVGTLAEGLTATGFSEDGIIEALERPGGYLLGVQWHPEADPDSPVIKSLVNAARARRNAPGRQNLAPDQRGGAR